ncbi:hypothetical protein SOV_26990 [Sporomusa ovata DSM 2662]|uniref:Uncharacterized protein n=1 Tax=Sporomusa ovata TaxID=2378 RepID=A0A0U1L4J9_9FIRM|nr:hypothetical protein [Sporomusa ovata]CQR74590.1 hypothetical protein SpAn4DRAFT_1052 [Sporomusa ovata]
MKLVTVILGLIILLSVPLSAGAITLINNDVILEAQEYGVKRSKMPLSDFLQPWLAYEEQAAIINETTERAYLYTPFLLLAYDARDKAISKQSIELANSEQILADYAGCLVFSIIVNGNTEKFSDNVQVIIKQEKKIIKPYHAVINPPVKNPWASNEPHYTAHYYFYFYEQDVVLSKPITLTVTTKDKQERRFYFELPNFK